MINDENFDVEEAINVSQEAMKNFSVELLLTDPRTGKKMFIVSPPQQQPDGAISILCASESNPEDYIAHIIYTEVLSKNDVMFETPETSEIISDPNSGKLVGLDGKPLN